MGNGKRAIFQLLLQFLIFVQLYSLLQERYTYYGLELLILYREELLMAEEKSPVQPPQSPRKPGTEWASYDPPPPVKPNPPAQK